MIFSDNFNGKLKSQLFVNLFPLNRVVLVGFGHKLPAVKTIKYKIDNLKKNTFMLSKPPHHSDLKGSLVCYAAPKCFPVTLGWLFIIASSAEVALKH